jgi:F0F1-type ATP synthase beta subunit
MNLGAVASLRGSVVDIRFDEHLPPIYSLLRAGADKRIVIEVLAQRDAHHVQRADRNIQELLEKLQGTFHRLRRSDIDKELFEVISGFEALILPFIKMP